MIPRFGSDTRGDVLARPALHTIRVLTRDRGFTAVAVLSLALGIGANTAVFTLINALLLRSLPVRHPERLVELSSVRRDGKIPFSYPTSRELERGQRVFPGLIGWSPRGDVQRRSKRRAVARARERSYRELLFRTGS